MTRDELTARARTAVFLVFAANGAGFASLASRFPDLKLLLGLTPGELGLTLLVGAAGAVIGLPASGWLTDRFGARAATRMGSLSMLGGYTLATVSAGVLGHRTLLTVGLFLGSVGIGVWDVAMNLEGAAVEKRQSRTIMPWFHAAFSGGTVLAALIGALASGAKVPVQVHVPVAAGLVVLVCWWATRKYLPRALEEDPSGEQATTPDEPVSVASAWTEPRTLLVGVMVLVAALTEGTANDWIAVALHEGHHLPTWAGVIGFAVFLSAMTLGRIIGAGLLDKHGRVPVLRLLFGAAAVGSLLVVFGGPVGAYAGAAIWGVGASLGFPVGMSAAADDPRRAASRMAVVSTIGYVAFLAGPPALGFLGDHVGVLRSLLVVGVLAIVAFFVVPAAREPEQTA